MDPEQTLEVKGEKTSEYDEIGSIIGSRCAHSCSNRSGAKLCAGLSHAALRSRMARGNSASGSLHLRDPASHSAPGCHYPKHGTPSRDQVDRLSSRGIASAAPQQCARNRHGGWQALHSHIRYLGYWRIFYLQDAEIAERENTERK